MTWIRHDATGHFIYWSTILVLSLSSILPYWLFQIQLFCGLSLHLGSSESRKTLEQKFIFQIGTLNPIGINERFSI